MQRHIKRRADRTHIVFFASTVASAVILTMPAWPQTSINTTKSGEGASTLAPGSLDGQQFKAGIVRKGADESKKQPLGDILIFRKGKFSSAVCKRYNFTDAPYWVRVEGEKTHFLAELTSPTDGKMVWKGTIHKGKLQGTMRWTKKRWYWTVDAEHKIRGKLDSDAIAASPSTK
jgi:hypothetical protein